jgi:hypothetical protein
MSAHPAPRATRPIRAETAGSSGLTLGPNQRGKGGGEVEASIPVMAMARTLQGLPIAFALTGAKADERELSEHGVQLLPPVRKGEREWRGAALSLIAYDH